MKRRFKNEKGLTLTFAVLMTTLTMILAAWALDYTYNTKRIMDSASGYELQATTKAEAGIVHAYWELRMDPDGLYRNPAYDPPAYWLDLDGDGGMDVQVDISAVNVQGLRKIEASGTSALGF